MKEFFERIGTLALLFFLVLSKAALMLLTITFSQIGLGPDEAQYWTWSKDLSWGYYSKPPGIAWQIWLGTHYLGDTEVGVRFMSVALSCLYPFLIYFLAWFCGLAPWTCFCAGMVMALSPLGIASSFFAITDVGMIFFWILTCMAIVASLRCKSVQDVTSRGLIKNEEVDAEKEAEISLIDCQEKVSMSPPPRYIWIGIFIGLGALFKWPIYILWAFIIGLLPFARQFIHKQFFVGLGLSLLGLLPSIIWNFNHDWVTFRHVFYTLFTAGQSPRPPGPSLCHPLPGHYHCRCYRSGLPGAWSRPTGRLALVGQGQPVHL